MFWIQGAPDPCSTFHSSACGPGSPSFWASWGRGRLPHPLLSGELHQGQAAARGGWREGGTTGVFFPLSPALMDCLSQRFYLLVLPFSCSLGLVPFLASSGLGCSQLPTVANLRRFHYPTWVPLTLPTFLQILSWVCW